MTPTFWSLLPPIVAVVLALATKRVELSLLMATLSGALVANHWHIADSLISFGRYLVGAVGLTVGESGQYGFEYDHIQITLFSVLVAMTVGLVGKAGGTRALVKMVEPLAKGKRGAQGATWLAGFAVFFDDYANCLVVGGAMRSLTDRFGVSRAKLAYIVDSTAAPIASLAVVSTWVGYEIGLIDDGLGVLATSTSGLEIYMASIPYRFYALFTLAFVLFIGLMGRDFGPMLAEERASKAVEPDDLKEVNSASAWVAALPILLLVSATFVDLYTQGMTALGTASSNASLIDILGEANPFTAMMKGSALAFTLALVLTLPKLGRKVTLETMKNTAGTVLRALVVLFLAWALGAAIGETQAAEYLGGALQGNFPPEVLPAATFLLAGAIAFSTGTSWGTMGMLFPMALPLAIAVSPEVGPIVLGTVSAILAGAIFGDHSSPISDTTILSSVGSGSDVLTHVKTQMPYALTAGVISVLFGYLPAGYGVSPFILIPIGVVGCVVAILLLGSPVDQEHPITP